jgi:Cu-Zn family superoxide dismutase
MIGSVAVREANGGVEIRVTAVGLTPGDHGVHLHASPLCDGPAFQTAGGHLNPGAKQHGHQNPAGPHLGDLGNLRAGTDGGAVGTFTVAGTTIRMLLGNAGIALLIHAAPDDEKTDPSGGSGARVGCAVLRESATNSSPSSA